MPDLTITHYNIFNDKEKIIKLIKEEDECEYRGVHVCDPDCPTLGKNNRPIPDHVIVKVVVGSIRHEISVNNPTLGFGGPGVTIGTGVGMAPVSRAQSMWLRVGDLWTQNKVFGFYWLASYWTISLFGLEGADIIGHAECLPLRRHVHINQSIAIFARSIVFSVRVGESGSAPSKSLHGSVEAKETEVVNLCTKSVKSSNITVESPDTQSRLLNLVRSVSSGSIFIILSKPPTESEWHENCVEFIKPFSQHPNPMGLLREWVIDFDTADDQEDFIDIWYGIENAINKSRATRVPTVDKLKSPNSDKSSNINQLDAYHGLSIFSGHQQVYHAVAVDSDYSSAPLFNAANESSLDYLGFLHPATLPSHPHTELNPKFETSSSNYSVPNNPITARQPPQAPGGYLEPNRHFFVDASPVEILETLFYLLTSQKVDCTLQPESFQIKCEANRERGRTEFRVRVFSSTASQLINGKYAVEFMRRFGDVNLFHSVYSELTKTLNKSEVLKITKSSESLKS